VMYVSTSLGWVFFESPYVIAIEEEMLKIRKRKK